MSTVTNVLKGVVRPAALAVAVSGVLLGQSVPAWAAPEDPPKGEVCDEGGGSGESARSSGPGTRDAASGQASGKRSCMAIKTKGTGAQRKAGPDDDCDDTAEGVKSPRDAATGQASGKREAGTGKATGKREAGSGMATGKRQAC